MTVPGHFSAGARGRGQINERAVDAAFASAGFELQAVASFLVQKRVRAASGGEQQQESEEKKRQEAAASGSGCLHIILHLVDRIKYIMPEARKQT